MSSSRNPAFAGRYTIRRELGQGGMATVYLARDEKHHRDVALKVLKKDLAAVVGAERFLREIAITAGLNHPHILPLLDSGTTDGLFFYVMPYVAGGSLRNLLEAGDPLPLEAVLRIVAEVASALDHAHTRGVVHRDIKPENILFNEGLAVVSDFGIARAVSDAQRDGVTRTGLAVGTPGYMSPEQALGTGAVDARSDVYALGCVSYELLIGGTPASWPGPEDVRLGRFADLPSDHRRRMDRHPGRVEQVLTKALALRPSDRYRHAGEFSRALQSASERTPTFSEEQVRALLERASKLQAAEPEEPSRGALTMGGVEQIAAQVGIPPEHVRKAARELTRPEAVPVRVGGEWRQQKGPKWDRIVVEEEVDGQVPESAFPRMVGEIQRHLDLVGHASVIGGTLTWSPAAQSESTRRIVISVTPEGGRTLIRLQETLEIQGFKKVVFPIGALTGAAFGAAIAGGLGMGEPAGPLLALSFIGMGIFSALRLTTSIDAGEKGPQLQALGRALRGLAVEASEKRLGAG
ncbi:MAG: serine/threonine-protein kinase [Longimicrobiales bacterium]